jgi:hypothetical protein
VLNVPVDIRTTRQPDLLLNPLLLACCLPQAIEAAIERLSKCHPEHISQYGTGNEDRLTGGP